LSTSKPEISRYPGGILSLSGSGLKELLLAVIGKGVPFRFQARGASMYPFIQDRDLVTISPLKNGKPRPGDSIAFCLPDSGKLAVHRIIGRKAGGFLTRGDNSAGPDGLVPLGDVFGLVTRVERQGKRTAIGRGPEKRLIAVLSRGGFLVPLISISRSIVRFAFKG
jgi:hypothetical protein